MLPFFFLLSFLLDQKRNKKIKAVKTFLENLRLLPHAHPKLLPQGGSSDTGFPFTSEWLVFFRLFSRPVVRHASHQTNR